MADITDLLPKKTVVPTPQGMPVRGVVSTPPASLGALTLRVIVPGHSSDYDVECRWIRQGQALPIALADCLVVFDETGAGTVVWWAVAPVGTVTSLPASPIDGQVIDYLADATNGVIWRFRYRAGSASTYKWETVGGCPLLASVETLQNLIAGTGYQDVSTAGPSLTLPLGGDYDLAYGATLGDAAQNRCIASPSIAGATPLDANAVWSAGGPTTGANDTSVHRMKRFPGLSATNVIKLMYRNALSSTTATYEKRWVSVMPVRVG